MDNEVVKVLKILLDDQKEYYLLERIESEKFIYLFLSNVENNDILLRKFKVGEKMKELYKLDSTEEMAFAFQLFFQRHPNLRVSH